MFASFSPSLFYHTVSTAIIKCLSSSYDFFAHSISVLGAMHGRNCHMFYILSALFAENSSRHWRVSRSVCPFVEIVPTDSHYATWSAGVGYVRVPCCVAFNWHESSVCSVWLVSCRGIDSPRYTTLYLIVELLVPRHEYLCTSYIYVVIYHRSTTLNHF